MGLIGVDNVMAEFWNYDEEKWWWFATYLQLAAAICAYPSLSAKNSDFKDNVVKLDFPIDIEEDRRIHGTHGT